MKVARCHVSACESIYNQRLLANRSLTMSRPGVPSATALAGPCCQARLLMAHTTEGRRSFIPVPEIFGCCGCLVSESHCAWDAWKMVDAGPLAGFQDGRLSQDAHTQQVMTAHPVQCRHVGHQGRLAGADSPPPSLHARRVGAHRTILSPAAPLPSQNCSKTIHDNLRSCGRSCVARRKWRPLARRGAATRGGRRCGLAALTLAWMSTLNGELLQCP
jgi:hypothetical protein